MNSFGDINNTIVSGYWWRCGTQAQYQNCGVTITAGSFNALNSKLTAADCSEFSGSTTENHWASTETGDTSARIFYISGTAFAWGQFPKQYSSRSGNNNHVRPIFTF